MQRLDDRLGERAAVRLVRVEHIDPSSVPEQARPRSLLGAGTRSWNQQGRRPRAENLHRRVVTRPGNDEIGGSDVAERIGNGDANRHGQSRRATLEVAA